MQNYTVNKKTHGINGFGLPPPDYVVAVKFDGTAVASITVPGDIPMGVMGAIGSINPVGNVGKAPKGRKKYIAKFEYGTETPGDVFVSVNTSTTIPATNDFVINAGELHPTAYDVFQDDTIYAACATADQTMTVAFYFIQE